jgi:hypothetical protein
MSQMFNKHQLLAVVTFVSAGASAPQAAAQDAPVDCKLDCKDLEARVALSLEYDLCGATDQARAISKARLLERAGDKLSAGGECLVKALSANDETKPLVKVVIVPKESARASQAPEMLSSNLSFARACLAPIGAGQLVPPAHRDLTRRGAQNTNGFHFGNTEPTKLLELASEQPDTYEWLNPAAHAQTPNGATQSKLEAIKIFKKYVTDVTSKTVKACCARDKPVAAYQLGYLMHAVQDLATHSGMTNDEHAYLLRKANPDLDSKNLTRAERWTKQVLKLYGDSATFGQCVKDASDIEASTANWDTLARRGGYGIKDASEAELVKFVMGALRLKRPADQTWFKPAAADKWFNDNIVPIIQTSLASTCE